MLDAGLAMRNAVAGDLARIPGIQVSLATGEQEAGHPIHGIRALSPRPGEGAAGFLHGQAPLHDFCWVVAPETGGLLLRVHEAVGAQRWIGCSAAAIRMTASKKATCAALDAAGIATPLVFSGGPWIVKPDDGAGTLQTRLHATRAAAEEDLQARLRAGQSALLQPFVAGEPLSIAIIVGPVLARPVAFNRQRLETDGDGWLHDLGVQPAALDPAGPRAAQLQALAERVVAALPGLRGYVGVDVVWNERKGPVVIEVNPRVTCAYVGLSAILQRNLAADILAAHGCKPGRQVAGHAAT